MANDEYRTPKWLFETLNSTYQFDLDAACTRENCLVRSTFGHPQGLFKELGSNALHVEWYRRGSRIFVNPPYSQKAGPLFKWVEKMHKAWIAGCTVVAILPCTPATKWYQSYVKGSAYVYEPPFRIQFDDEHGKPTKSARHDTIICVWHGWETAIWLRAI